MPKHSGLYRPRTPLSYRIDANNDTAERSDQVAKSEATSTKINLRKRVLLLDLIIRRNKNQHRNQAFFKQACPLRKALRQLLQVETALEILKTEGSSGAVTSAEAVRRRFETESNLRGRKEVLEEHVREVLAVKCWVVFSSLVGDSQFANLGLVLLALLGEITAGEGGVGILRKGRDIESTDESKHVSHGRQSENTLSDGDGANGVSKIMATSTKVTGEDQGEVIEREYDSGHDHLLEAGEAERAMSSMQTFGNRLPAGIVVKDAIAKGSEDVDNAVQIATNQTRIGATRKRVTEAGAGKRKKKSTSAIDDLFKGII